jgi:DNA-binding response OmpR family regulator
MNRVLLIDHDHDAAQAAGMICLDQGIAFRAAHTLCDGVRLLLDAPVSLIVIDAGLVRLSPAEQARMFDAVAPEVPVVVLVKPNAPLEEHVRFESEGFRVVPKPVDMTGILAKVDMAGRPMPARRGAAARVRALCG